MRSVTPRQRLMAAMRGDSLDRVPIVIRGINPYAREMNWRGEADPSYRPLLELVRERCEVEHLCSISRGYFLNGADLEVERSTQVHGHWRETCVRVTTPRGPLESVAREGIGSYSHATVKHWITSETDVERFLSLPYEPAAPDLAPYRAAEETLGECGYTLPYLDGPVGWVHALTGSELLAIWSIEAPSLLHALLEAMQERCRQYLHAFLAAGRVPIVGLQGQEAVTPPLLSPARFDDLVVQYEAPLVEQIHRFGAMVYVHCHGYLGAVLERFAAMGVDVLHPVEAPPMGDVTLAEAKRRVGHSICLAGNVQIGDIMTRSRSEVAADVAQAMREGKPGGRFILTLTATPFERVLSPRTLDNLTAMVDVAHELGGY